MGMLATVMNALAMQNALEKIGVDTRVQSAIPMATVSEPYIRRRAVRHMEKGRVVIFAAGTGNPYLHHRHRRRPARRRNGLRRLVQGHQRRRRLRCRSEEGEPTRSVMKQSLSISVLSDNLKVMDATAVALCRDNNIPIVVFNIREQGNLARVLGGDGTATIVQNEGG